MRAVRPLAEALGARQQREDAGIDRLGPLARRAIERRDAGVGQALEGGDLGDRPRDRIPGFLAGKAADLDVHRLAERLGGLADGGREERGGSPNP